MASLFQFKPTAAATKKKGAKQSRKKPAARSPSVERTPSAASAGFQSIVASSSPQTALGRSSQARIAQAATEAHARAVGQDSPSHGLSDTCAAAKSFFEGTAASAEGDASESLRSRRVSFGAPTELEFVTAADQQPSDVHDSPGQDNQ